MKHKWHKEILHWAEGGEIECFSEYYPKAGWQEFDGDWDDADGAWTFRIKVPQSEPEQPTYLYVYGVGNKYKLNIGSPLGMPASWVYVGKIKLEENK